MSLAAPDVSTQAPPEISIQTPSQSPPAANNKPHAPASGVLSPSTHKRPAPLDFQDSAESSTIKPPHPKRPARIGQPPLHPTHLFPIVSHVQGGFAAAAEQILRTNEYTYEPLNAQAGEQLRILRITAGEENEALHCTLVPADLESDYEALSYYWGNDEPSHEIKILTYKPDKSRHKSFRNVKPLKFYIRSNLFAALRTLREPKTDVDLWVDAICINQDDDAEKKTQVAKMEQIYSKAGTVLIWLGQSTPSSDIAFPFIEEMCQLRVFDSLLDHEHAEKWEALAELMRNVWFSRRWVVQELALAKEASLHSGKHAIHWDDFADAIAFFALKFDKIKKFPRKTKLRPEDPEPLREVGKLGPNVLVDATSNLFRRSENGDIIERRQTLETLVSTLTAYEASDPRDTVYAILSLAKDTTRKQESGSNLQKDHGIRPDYEKDLMEVCKDFVKSCYDCSGSLDILCRHWAPIAKKFTKLEAQDLKRGLTLEVKNWATQRELPSWMPSISGAPYGAPQDSLSGRVHGDSFVGEPNRRNYNASFDKFATGYVEFGGTEEDPILRSYRYACKDPKNSSSPVVTPSIPRKVSDGTMSVTGLRIDTLMEVGPRSINGVISAESLKMGGWVPDPRGQVEPDPPDELWRTMVADRGPGGTNAPKWYLRACRHSFAQRSVTGDIDTRLLIDQDRDSIVVEFLKRVSDVIWNRSFFRTQGEGLGSRSRLGLASFSAHPGDIVCIIYGCTVPVLLRERPDKDGFTFIGECYVHGMMDGEVTLYVKRSQLKDKEEKFLLR
jgi:hypothetical protein